MSEGNLQDQVEDIVKVNFGVSNCPARILKKFKKFAEEKANNSYSLAIERLLEITELNDKEVAMFAALHNQEERLNKLEGKEEEEKPKKIKRFGGG